MLLKVLTIPWQLKEWTPQVSHVAKILLDYGKYSPGDVPAVSVHFENMRDIWKDKMQGLTNLVDSATDTAKFIEACGMLYEFYRYLCVRNQLFCLVALLISGPFDGMCANQVYIKFSVKIKANSSACLKHEMAK